MKSKDSSYFLVAVILIIFSLIGAWYLLRPKTTALSNEDLTQAPTPETPYVPDSSLEEPSSGDATVSPSSPANDSDEPAPTPQFQNFTSSYDKFSVTYTSDRKLYEDKEGSGTRYTFYRKSGNISVHVGPGWSWSHPDRNFTSDFLVSGQPTFRYDITAQTIVDVQYGGLNYTIQCIHNSTTVNKEECEAFLESFKLLTK